MTRLILIFLCLCVTASANAQLFKCKRSDGNATFQDSPCPDGSTSTKIAAPPPSDPEKITLTADMLGHFHTEVSINDVIVQGLIDTGASMLTISSATASSMKIAQNNGRFVRAETANGNIVSYIKTVPMVQLGKVKLYNVDVVISDISPTLIGMSVLKNFKMNAENGQLVLVRK